MSDRLLSIAQGSWPAYSGWPEYNRVDPRIVAIHEAGHLVTVLALGAHAPDADFVAVSEGDCGRLYRVRDGKRVAPPAQVRATPYPCHRDADASFKRMVLDRGAVYLGGFVAESLTVGFDLDGWPRALLETDDSRSAILFLSLVWPERFDGPLFASWLRARETLQAERDWLMRVAAVIEQTGECSRATALMMRD